MPLSKVTLDFFNHLVAEPGIELFYVCSECDQQPKIDAEALVLFNRTCTAHGSTWHRLMMKSPDGSVKLAMRLDNAKANTA